VSNFYLYAALLIALSSLFVIIPLLIKAKSNRLQLSNANVVKQRIIELDREVEEGLISEKDKLSSVRDLKLALVEEFDIASIEKVIRGYAEEIGISAGKAIHPIRLALTGRGVSPGLFEIMEVLGKKTVHSRLQRAIEELKS